MRLQGRADNPINRTGRAQAEALVPLLKDKELELIVASPLQRARQTAEIIAAALHIPVVTDSRLVEVGFGSSDGMAFADFRKKFGDDYLQRMLHSVADEDMDISAGDGAETKREAQTRVVESLTDIALNKNVRTVGVACHGLVMTLIAGYLNVQDVLKFGNGDLLRIAFDEGRWRYIGIHRQP